MILHLIETGGPGGAEQMLLRLAEEYGRRGLSQAICLRKEGWLAGEVRRRDLPLKIIPIGALPDVCWLRELRQLTRNFGVTAIHAHEFAMNVRGAMLGIWLGIRVVATVHGKGYYGEKWLRRQAYRLTSRSAWLVAVSEDIRQQLIKACGVNSRRVRVILNGVDTERFQYNEQKRRLFRERFGIRNDQLLLGTVGSYYPVKGHRFLIEAMKGIVGVNHNVKLVMAGQGPLADELRKQAEDSALGECINIVGYVEDTPGFLSALDIFVLPSLSEGLPLALLEAAANRRCIVATDVGGTPEIIVHKENGILVQPGDAKALRDALVELFDPRTRFSLAANAFATVTRDWSIQRTADRYLELLLALKSAENLQPHGSACS